MVRHSLLCAAVIGGLAACGSSNKNGGTSGDGGSDAGCGLVDYQEGTCNWPDYCLSNHCVAAQNISAAGSEVPAAACAAETKDGNENLDAVRLDAGKELLQPDSPIITQLNQILVDIDGGCALDIDHNVQPYEESANACAGGAPDHSGAAVCTKGDAAVLFQGFAFDPKGLFQTAEGASLDSQFYWLDHTGVPVKLSDEDDAVGAMVAGHIIPGSDWSAKGGSFILAQCLGGGQHGFYPSEINGYPVILHFADTGLAGNSFCTPWVE